MKLVNILVKKNSDQNLSILWKTYEGNVRQETYEYHTNSSCLVPVKQCQNKELLSNHYQYQVNFSMEKLQRSH